MRKLDLRSYLFICLGVLAALPALLLGVNQTHQWEAEQVSQADRESLLAAQALARAVDQKVEQHVQTVELLAQQVEARDSWDPADLQRIVSAQRKSIVGNTLMFIGDAAGRSIVADPVLDADGGPSAPKDYSDRDYYLAVKGTERTSISRAQIGRVSKKPSFQIAAPIFDAEGTFVGFAEGSVDLAAIQEMAERITASNPGMRAIVLDSEGRAIAHPDEAIRQEMRQLAGVPLFAATSAVEGEIRRGVDETRVEVRAAVAPIEILGLNWLVIVSQPEAAVQAQALSARRDTLFTAGMALLAGLVLAGALAAVLARPIEHLATAATAVGAGSFLQRLPTPRAWHPREVRSLLGAVGDMVVQLRARTEELEQRVAERTAALTAANAELDTRLHELKLARDESELTQQRYRSLFEHNPDAVYALDLDGFIFSANPGCEKVTGYSVSQLLGGSFIQIVVEDDLARAQEHFRRARAGEHQDYELTIVHNEGHEVHLRVSNLPIIVDGSIVGVYGIAKDVTEHKRSSAALEHMALHDTLTGLPNRNLLRDNLDEAIAAARCEDASFALLLMDLDRFKEVNDALGHHAGDELLQQVVIRMRQALRQSDVVARLGGDEFAVLLPMTDTLGATVAVQKILAAFEEPFLLEGQNVHVGASVGIAIGFEHGDDATELLRHADTAMYVAKRSKSGYAVYATDQDEHSLDRLSLVSDLKVAIEQDQLMLYYQPKISFKTSSIVRVEALVRWVHPEHGMIPPDQFIPLAEHMGLIRPLSRWVLNAALRQSSEWRQQGLDIPVAVNLSMQDLHDPELPQIIHQLLETWNVPAASLIVELTETSLMVDSTQGLAVLMRLRQLGVEIAVDDFGAGHAALGYLKQLPLTELKIDRSFVKDMLNTSNDAALVRSTIDLAHNLGLEVVAEGVEDRETWDELAALGCDMAQGYYMSRPLAEPDLVRWVRESAWGLRDQDAPADPADLAARAA